jgi:DNA polymerase III psi subunit
MFFWSLYTQESLQSPWFIQTPVPTECTPRFNIPTQKVFVVVPGELEGALEMLGKMVRALKYKADEVSFLEGTLERVDQLAECDEVKSLIFFGDQFPGPLGQAMNWAGHKMIKTYSLKNLQEKPELKKLTWSHLKTFAEIA